MRETFWAKPQTHFKHKQYMLLETETWVVNKPKTDCETLNYIKAYDRNQLFQEKREEGTIWYTKTIKITYHIDFPKVSSLSNPQFSHFNYKTTKSHSSDFAFSSVRKKMLNLGLYRFPIILFLSVGGLTILL